MIHGNLQNAEVKAREEAANLHLVEAAAEVTATAIEAATGPEERSVLVQATQDKLGAVGLKVYDCSDKAEASQCDPVEAVATAKSYKTGRSREQVIAMSERSFRRQARLSVGGKKMVRMLAAAQYLRNTADSSKI